MHADLLNRDGPWSARPRSSAPRTRSPRVGRTTQRAVAGDVVLGGRAGWRDRAARCCRWGRQRRPGPGRGWRVPAAPSRRRARTSRAGRTTQRHVPSRRSGGGEPRARPARRAARAGAGGRVRARPAGAGGELLALAGASPRPRRWRRLSGSLALRTGSAALGQRRALATSRAPRRPARRRRRPRTALNGDSIDQVDEGRRPRGR